MRLVFDIETDGLLDELTTIHSLCIKDVDSGFVWSCTDHPYSSPNGADTSLTVKQGVELLMEAELIIGHNVIKFDLPAIQKVFPWYTYDRLKVFDTITISRLVWPKDDLREKDFRLQKAGKLPGKLIGRYSLEAWGYRLGEYKGDYKGPWGTWSPEMQEYCEQDIEVTHELFRRIEKREWSERSIWLEHQVQFIVARQERHGFLFDKQAAAGLYATLVQRRAELLADLQDAFPPWTVETLFIPKVNNKTRGYVKGVPFIKKKTIQFNPASRQHISGRLKEKY